MYTLKIINTKKFDRLPYKHAKEAVGLADPKTKTAYVRHIPGMQKVVSMIAMHEIDELVAKVSPHETEGIRYKKGRDIFAPIGTALLGMIPGIGPALSAVAAGGYAGYQYSKGEIEQPWQIPLSAVLAYGGSKLAQGTVGYKAGVEASIAQGGGMFGQTLTGMQGLTGLTDWGALASGAPITAPAVGGLNTSLGPYAPLATDPAVANWATGGIPSLTATTAPGMFGSIGTSLATGTALDTLSTSLKGAISPLSPTSAPAVPTSQAGQVTAAPKEDIWSKVGNAILGGGEGGMSPETIGKLLMGGSGLAQVTAEAPELKYTPQEYVAQAKATMKKYNLDALPQYAQEEARKLVELPTEGPALDARVNDFAARTVQDLETSRATQLQTINQRYTQAGATGDTQQAEDIARVNDYVNGQIALARGEARATILAQSYQVKSNALQIVMQAGEFDSKLAYDLAVMVGKEDELTFAIQQEDYASFQETMSDIFGMGMQQVMESIMRKQFPGQSALA